MASPMARMGYVVDNTLISRAPCANVPGKCQRVAHITADPDLKIVRMEIDAGDRLPDSSALSLHHAARARVEVGGGVRAEDIRGAGEAMKRAVCILIGVVACASIVPGTRVGAQGRGAAVQPAHEAASSGTRTRPKSAPLRWPSSKAGWKG